MMEIHAVRDVLEVIFQQIQEETASRLNFSHKSSTGNISYDTDVQAPNIKLEQGGTILANGSLSPDTTQRYHSNLHGSIQLATKQSPLHDVLSKKQHCEKFNCNFQDTLVIP